MKGGCLFSHLSGEKEDMYEDWFRRSTEEVVSALETDVERGLARETAAARLVELGANELDEGEKIFPVSKWKRSSTSTHKYVAPP